MAMFMYTLWPLMTLNLFKQWNLILWCSSFI